MIVLLQNCIPWHTGSGASHNVASSCEYILSSLYRNELCVDFKTQIGPDSLLRSVLCHGQNELENNIPVRLSSLSHCIEWDREFQMFIFFVIVKTPPDLDISCDMNTKLFILYYNIPRTLEVIHSKINFFLELSVFSEERLSSILMSFIRNLDYLIAHNNHLVIIRYLYIYLTPA